MERYVNWYILQLKAWGKKKTCWLQILGMCLLTGIVLSVSIPQTDNLNIGICNIQGENAGRIVEILEQSDSIFSFRRYMDEEEMRSDIVSGRLECGFAFAEDFDEKIQSMKLRDSIRYVETPFLTKGKVARETVFTAFLQVYDEQILEDSIKDIYGSYDAEILKELLERNREYIGGEEVFQIQQEIVPVQQEKTEKSGKTYPVQGIVALFLFGVMFMEHGRKFDAGKMAVLKALEIKERRIFTYLGMLGTVTIAMIVGVLLVINAADNRGVWQEIFYMLLYVIYSALWILFVGQLFRNKTTFMAWATTLLVIQLFLCPVFMDFSAYIKALRYVSYFFPMGIYLRL